MTQRVIAQNGSTVTVATTADVADPTNLPVATTTANGVVKKMTNQNASTATDVAGLVADFNILLTKLKAAGMM